MDKNKLKQVKQNANINVVSGYCAKCLKELSGSDEVTRDHENNLFCDFQCKQGYWAEIRRELDCFIYTDYR